MGPAIPALLLALLADSTAPAPLVQRALAAVERGEAPARRRELERGLAAAPRDRALRFELATLERLTYRPEPARRYYESLRLPGGQAPDRLAVASEIGVAWLDVAAGRVSGVGPRLVQAAHEALALDDRELAVEAILLHATVASRGGAGVSSDTLFLEAARLVPDTAVALRARLRCQRAGPPQLGDELEELAEARAGLALARTAGSRRVEAQCLASQARALFRLNQVDSALAVNARAISIQQSVSDGAGLASSLQWHGYALVAARRYAEARATLLGAVDAGRSSGYWPPVLMSLTSLASLSVRFGELGGARRYAMLGDSLAGIHGNDRVRAGLASVRGDVARASGDSAAARALYDSALALGGRYGGAAPHRGLAALARDAGNWDEAERQLALARAQATGHGMATWARRLDHDAGSIALARGDLALAERRYEAFLTGLPTDERESALTARLRLAEIAARRGEVDAAESLAVAAFDDLDRWRRSVNDDVLRLHAQGLTELDLDPGAGVVPVVQALARAGAPDRALALLERARARSLADDVLRLEAWGSVPARPGRPLRQEPIVRDRLPEGVAILAFAVGGPSDPSVALIAWAGGVVAVEGPSRREIDVAAARLRSLVEAGRDPAMIDRSLTTQLVGPALERIPAGVRTLIVVPDGGLHRAPFDALRAGDGLLVDRVAVVLAPSAGLALRARDSVPALSVLALGNPAAPARPRGAESEMLWRAFAAAGGLPPLPESEREARSVAGVVSGSTLRLRGAASESFVKSAPLSRYSLIHVAAHAVVSDDDLGGAAVALAPDALADGYLTAADLAGLELAAELVVLSGCRTARGVVVAGEGVQGLTAPLLRAGARSVLATSWAVRDSEAAQFVALFYRELGVDGRVVPALRRAKLDARQSGMPASVWAGFVLTGDASAAVRVPRPAVKALR